MVIARGVFLIHHELHPEGVLQIEEVFLLVAYDHRDARFLKLADLALYEHFTPYREDAFGLLVGYGSKTRGHPRC